MGTLPSPSRRFLYWLRSDRVDWARASLENSGFRLKAALLTPCQVLHARNDSVYFASPEVWSRMCGRQSSWYRSSERVGQTMVMSTRRLPTSFDPYLDSEVVTSDFSPETLPTERELLEIIDSREYRGGKPDEWEKVSTLDRVMITVLFWVKGFWKKGDTFRRHWVGHRANHANFLSRRYTTEIDGKEVPYSVTPNESVCSSCAEFFNVVEPEARKLVQACPGAVIFGGAERGVYLDVIPLGRAGAVAS